MKKRKFRYHNVHVLMGKLLVPVRVRYTFGEQTILLQRTQLDLYNGTPGNVIDCANSQCANRLEKLFPHPVKCTEFTDSRAWIVTKRNKRGVPTDAVVYRHFEGPDQRMFDSPGGKQRMIKAGMGEKVVRLTPIPPSQRKPHPWEPHPKSDGTTTKKKPRGSWLRAQRAGLIAPI